MCPQSRIYYAAVSSKRDSSRLRSSDVRGGAAAGCACGGAEYPTGGGAEPKPPLE